MNILYLAAECVPFAKVGGLGDVAGALPKELEKLGNKVLMFLPKYGTIDENMVRAHCNVPLQKTKIQYDIKIAGKKYACALWRAYNIYFIENKNLFSNGGVYDGKNLLLKFSLFCHASLEGAKKIGFKPDIINCNDWHTALVSVILKTILKDDAFFKNTKTVLSIHNIGYQGEFPLGALPDTGLDKSSLILLEHNKKINLMKAGIETSDAINTVSPTYAKEIKTKAYGCGMEKLLAKKTIYGILNGADYEHWNPKNDKYIAKKYDKKNLQNKQLCKSDLQSCCGLKKEDIFLLGMVTRLVVQKGFDILAKVIDGILKLDLQIVILGTGEKKYEKLFTKLQKKYPDKVSVNLRFDNELAHKIEAGADAFLMPSKYEPCGLNQIYSLKYGTPPIVRKTGGLADTVINFDPVNAAGSKDTSVRGTGFVFENYDAKKLLTAVQVAFEMYEFKKSWNKLVKNAMSADFSWKKSAKEYVKMYRAVVSVKR